MLGLINDVLSYATLEGGRVEYHVVAVDLWEVVAAVVPLVEPQVAAKGLTLAVRLQAGPAVTAAGLMWADRRYSQRRGASGPAM